MFSYKPSFKHHMTNRKPFYLFKAKCQLQRRQNSFFLLALPYFYISCFCVFYAPKSIFCNVCFEDLFVLLSWLLFSLFSFSHSYNCSFLPFSKNTLFSFFPPTSIFSLFVSTFKEVKEVSIVKNLFDFYFFLLFIFHLTSPFECFTSHS